MSIRTFTRQGLVISALGFCGTAYLSATADANLRKADRFRSAAVAIESSRDTIIRCATESPADAMIVDRFHTTFNCEAYKNALRTIQTETRLLENVEIGDRTNYLAEALAKPQISVTEVLEHAPQITQISIDLENEADNLERTSTEKQRKLWKFKETIYTLSFLSGLITICTYAYSKLKEKSLQKEKIDGR